MEQGKERQDRGTEQGANKGHGGSTDRAGSRGRNFGGSRYCAHGGGGDEDGASDLLHVHDELNMICFGPACVVMKQTNMLFYCLSLQV